jgi:adenylate cyclase class IV
MANSEVRFEVEIRCHFDSQDQAFRTLPFLRTSVHREVVWSEVFYGLQLFKSGQVLRISDALGTGARRLLRWKGPDIGEFTNIREEVDENITTGIVNSTILKRLGGKETVGTADEAIQELERLGHRKFMEWRGHNLDGFHEPLGIKVKLMNCQVLKWPLLVEIEKTANTREEATQWETDLRELSREFQLESRLVREEPPTLLYAGLFTH